MFENTRALVEETGIQYLHVFPYSQRSGTPAEKMPQVNGLVKKQRAKILRELGNKNLSKFLQSRIGVTESVLIEGKGIGRTEHFAEVKMDGEAGLIKQIEISGQQNCQLTI